MGQCNRARDEAEREYYFLQAEVGRFDELSHGIKNWSITVSFALIAAAFDRGKPELFVVASIAACLFWVTEARWKRYQKVHIERIKVLERYFEMARPDYSGPRINAAFVEHLKVTKSLLKAELAIMWLQNVRLPHLFIFLGGLLLYSLSITGLLDGLPFDKAKASAP